MIICTDNLQKAKDLIKKTEHPIFIKSQNQEFDRKILEYGKFDVFLSPELNQEKDKIKKINSGFNHVLAKIAAKNKIALGIDLEKIRGEKEKKEKARVLARTIQNIKVCRKAKCRIVVKGHKDEKDAFAFLISLGASAQQANQATKLDITR